MLFLLTFLYCIMKTNVALIFFLKKSKNYVSGPVPIYLRITVNGKRADCPADGTANLNAGIPVPDGRMELRRISAP